MDDELCAGCIRRAEAYRMRAELEDRAARRELAGWLLLAVVVLAVLAVHYGWADHLLSMGKAD